MYLYDELSFPQEIVRKIFSESRQTAHELTRIIDTLDAERPDLVQHSAYILERDRRIHAHQAAGV